MIPQCSTFASLRWSTVRLFARMSTSCRIHKELYDFHVRTSCGHGDQHKSAVLHVKLSFAATMAMRRDVWPCDTRKTPRLLFLQLQQGLKRQAPTSKAARDARPAPTEREMLAQGTVPDQPRAQVQIRSVMAAWHNRHTAREVEQAKPCGSPVPWQPRV